MKRSNYYSSGIVALLEWQEGMKLMLLFRKLFGVCIILKYILENVSSEWSHAEVPRKAIGRECHREVKNSEGPLHF